MDETKDGFNKTVTEDHMDTKTYNKNISENKEESKIPIVNRKERRKTYKHKKRQAKKMEAVIKEKGNILDAAEKYTSGEVNYALFSYILQTKDFRHLPMDYTPIQFMQHFYEELWPTLARVTNTANFLESLVEDANIDMSEEEHAIWRKIKQTKTDMMAEAARVLEAQKKAIKK